MKKVTALVVIVLVVILLSSSTRAQASCTSYPDLQAQDDPTWGPFCADGGAGCTECLTWNPGPGMLFSDCFYDWGTGDLYCFYYGTGVENQG